MATLKMLVPGSMAEKNDISYNIRMPKSMLSRVKIESKSMKISANEYIRQAIMRFSRRDEEIFPNPRGGKRVDAHFLKNLQKTVRRHEKMLQKLAKKMKF